MLEGRSVIVVAAPLDIFASYVQVRRAQEGAPRPPRLTWLSTASSALTIERPSADHAAHHSLTPASSPPRPRRHYRSPAAPFRVGDEVALPDYRAIVRATTEAGRPTTVDFEFPSRLEDAPVHWRTWRDGRYVPFAPPPDRPHPESRAGPGPVRRPPAAPGPTVVRTAPGPRAAGAGRPSSLAREPTDDMSGVHRYLIGA
jgi:hypothetical protein